MLFFGDYCKYIYTVAIDQTYLRAQVSLNPRTIIVKAMVNLLKIELHPSNIIKMVPSACFSSS